MKTWRLPKPDLQTQAAWAQSLNISPWLAQILINRGVASQEAAEMFLTPNLQQLPNPFLMPDMSQAAERIVQAIQRQEKIAVFGDYDVDGITSTALLANFFRNIHVPLETYIPQRNEGYGLNKKALGMLKKKGIVLLITVDCGTKSIEEIAHARTLGMDVIVTDHHDIPEILPQVLPKAIAVINPKRLSPGTMGRELAGVGVAFFLLLALRNRLRENGLLPQPEPNLKRELDLVALGTIADMAPLIGVNRILVTFGMQALASTERPGLVALKEISGVKSEALKTSDIGFKLGPRINAGGRIAQPQLGLELLLSQDMERARGLAKILNQCNEDRQSLQEKQLDQAKKMVGSEVTTLGIVVDSPHWHPGLIGLIASRLVEQHHRPAIAFCQEGENLKGSARSISELNIVAVLEECADLLTQFGGHHAAAGLSLPIKNLEAFKIKFEQTLQKFLGATTPTPHLNIDLEINLKDIEPSLVSELETLRPFGLGNPEPLFAVRGIQLKDPKIVGTNHLKLKISDNSVLLEAIAFGLGQTITEETSGDIACVPEWNTFRDTTKIQLKIKDLKII